MIKEIKTLGDEVEITVRIKLDSNSMLKSEEVIESALNDAGVTASKLALQRFDTDGSPIEVKGKVLTSKGLQKKVSRSIW